MTLALAKPAGWDEEDPLTSDEMNALQGELVKAIDGVNGGTYELDSDLVIDGPAPLRIAGELRIDVGATLDMDGTLELGGTTDLTGQFDVESTGDINVRPSGQIHLKTGSPGGRLDVESGARILIEDGGELLLEDGGEINIPAGDVILEDIGDMTVRDNGELVVIDGGMLNVGDDGDINVGGDPVNGGRINLVSGGKIIGSSGSEIQIFDMDDLTINNDSYVYIVGLEPIFVGSQWLAEESGTFICQSVSPSNRLVFPLKVPVGDVLTTLRMTINGGAGAGHSGTAPTDRCAMQLCRVAINGTLTVLQTVIDPTNTGPAYDIAHSVTMSGGVFPYTMTADRHVVRVLGEGLIGGVINTTRLCSIDGTALATSVRQTTEVR